MFALSLTLAVRVFFAGTPPSLEECMTSRKRSNQNHRRMNHMRYTLLVHSETSVLTTGTSIKLFTEQRLQSRQHGVSQHMCATLLLCVEDDVPRVIPPLNNVVTPTNKGAKLRILQIPT